MNIYLMKAEDVREVADIEKECFSIPWSYESLLDAVENENARYLVMRVEDAIVGYVGMWYGGDEAEVTNVAVAPSHRRKGYARRIMEAAKVQAMKDNMGKLFLEVRQSNEPAKALYSAMGFKSIGVRKNFYEKPVEDANVMIMRIGTREEGENEC